MPPFAEIAVGKDGAEQQLVVQECGFPDGLLDGTAGLQGEDMADASGFTGGKRLRHSHARGAVQRDARNRQGRLVVRPSLRLRLSTRIAPHDGNSRAEHPCSMRQTAGQWRPAHSHPILIHELIRDGNT
jgi:hypothetical protein